VHAIEGATAVRSQLGADEDLLWSGQPRHGVVFRASDVFLVPISLFWCGFAIFWELGVLTSDDAPLFFRLWGVFFVLAGLHFAFGRFLWDARQRSRTHYGVSNQRVLIVSGPGGNQVKWLSLRTLSDVSVSQMADGTGSIQFGPSAPFGTPGWFPGAGWPGVPAVPAFELIDNVRHVHDVIRQAQRRA
jgi:hypothetical protein